MVHSARARAFAVLTEVREPLSVEQTAVLNEVYGEVVRAHHPDVWRQVQRRCLNMADADDVVQDAFMSVHTWLVKNGFPASLRALVHALTKGVLLNYLTKRSTTVMSVALPSSTSEKPTSTSRPNTEREVMLRELAVRLLAQLPKEQRDAFEKVKMQGLSEEEAAAQLGIPVGTCTSRVRYAKEKLYASAVELLPPSQQGVA
jgi:RNA polymerase sigma-70 factor (ECF subfamily)